MNKLKLIFAGTPDFAARHLAALLSSGHEVVAVYTQPDKPAGRGQKLTASPVNELALAHNRLKQAGVNVLGVVFNDVQREGHRYDAYQYGYQYRSRDQ